MYPFLNKNKNQLYIYITKITILSILLKIKFKIIINNCGGRLVNKIIKVKSIGPVTHLRT